MKRRVCDVPWKWRASVTSSPSLTPRLTTQVHLHRDKACRRRSVDAREDAGHRKSTSLSDWNVASSSESRLTVIRSSPASARQLRLGRQQRTVGGQGQVGAERGEQRDEAFQVAPDERLAARDPKLAHAE